MDRYKVPCSTAKGRRKFDILGTRGSYELIENSLYCLSPFDNPEEFEAKLSASRGHSSGAALATGLSRALRALRRRAISGRLFRNIPSVRLPGCGRHKNHVQFKRDFEIVY